MKWTSYDDYRTSHRESSTHQTKYHQQDENLVLGLQWDFWEIPQTNIEKECLNIAPGCAKIIHNWINQTHFEKFTLRGFFPPHDKVLKIGNELGTALLKTSKVCYYI